MEQHNTIHKSPIFGNIQKVTLFFYFLFFNNRLKLFIIIIKENTILKIKDGEIFDQLLKQNKNYSIYYKKIFLKTECKHKFIILYI
jgi:hypothetical protein